MINSIVDAGSQPTSSVQSSAPQALPAVQAAPAAPAPAAKTAAAPTSASLQSAVTKLNDYVQQVQRTLSFSIDKDSGETVVKVIDAETQQVVQQIPAEATLQLAAAIDKQMEGESRLSNLFIKGQV